MDHNSASSFAGLGDNEYQWTPSQRQVFELLVRERSNAQIAEELGLSLEGAKWHLREITSKLGVSSREEAAEFWRARQRLNARAQRALGALTAVVLGKIGLLGLTGVVAVVLVVAMRSAWPTGTEALPASTPRAAATAEVSASATPFTIPPYFAVELSGQGSMSGPDFSPVGAATRAVAEAPALAHFSLTLSCDSGSVVLLSTDGPVGGQNASLVFTYPEGSSTCRWVVEATGPWQIYAK